MLRCSRGKRGWRGVSNRSGLARAERSVLCLKGVCVCSRHDLLTCPVFFPPHCLAFHPRKDYSKRFLIAHIHTHSRALTRPRTHTNTQVLGNHFGSRVWKGMPQNHNRKRMTASEQIFSKHPHGTQPYTHTHTHTHTHTLDGMVSNMIYAAALTACILF